MDICSCWRAFLILAGLAYLSWYGFLDLRSKSRLRLLLLICALASGLAYTPFYYGQIEWRANTMTEEASRFAKENDLEIESITLETLYLLEEELSKLQLSSTQNRFLLTSEFNKQVDLLFKQNPNWQSFHFLSNLLIVTVILFLNSLLT